MNHQLVFSQDEWMNESSASRTKVALLIVAFASFSRSLFWKISTVVAASPTCRTCKIHVDSLCNHCIFLLLQNPFLCSQTQPCCKMILFFLLVFQSRQKQKKREKRVCRIPTDDSNQFFQFSCYFFAIRSGWTSDKPRRSVRNFWDHEGGLAISGGNEILTHLPGQTGKQMSFSLSITWYSGTKSCNGINTQLEYILIRTSMTEATQLKRNQKCEIRSQVLTTALFTGNLNSPTWNKALANCWPWH